MSTSLPRDDDALGAVADRVLEMLAGRAEAAVTVTHLSEGLTRFANSFIHQNVGDEHVSVTFDVVLGGRSASASASGTGDDALARLVDAALAAASVQPVDRDWAGLAPPAPVAFGPHDSWDPATATAGPAERADLVAAFVAAGEGLEAAGYCETSAERSVFANSAGQRAVSAVTKAAIDGIQRCEGSDGVGSILAGRLAELDGEAAGRRAAGSARRGEDPVELPPGRYEVVLEPRCVAYMLDFLTVYGFNARAVQESRSYVRLGERQMDRALSIWDDVTDARQPGPAFDAEGTPKQRTSLVQEGRSVGLAHDRRTAAKAGPGVSGSGHAVPGGAASGPVARNLFLDGAERAPIETLVGGVRRGLLVKDFWYARVLDPKTLVVTGLTRNGVFLIEDGQVGRAVGNLRFTQSPVSAFGPGRVLGVGDDATLAPGGLHLAWHHTPSLRLAGWNFTGNASG